MLRGAGSRLTTPRACASLRAMAYKLGTMASRRIMGDRISRVLSRGPQSIASIGASTGYDFGQLVIALRSMRDAGRVQLSSEGLWSLASPPEQS
jgi:hypothetical protein